MKKNNIKASVALALSVFSGCSMADQYMFMLPADISPSDSSQIENPTSPEEEDNNGGWLRYFHEINTLKYTSLLEDWGSNRDEAFFYDPRGLSDSTIPKGRFGVSSIGKMTINGTPLTHINFMKGVKSADIINVFYNKNMSNIDGIKDLEFVNILSLYNNNIKNLDSLLSLKFARSIELSGNPQLNDITGLRNLYIQKNSDYPPHPTAIIIFDKESLRHKNKPSAGSNFCKSVELGGIEIQLSGGGQGRAKDVCNSDSEWIDFVHSLSYSWQNYISVSTIASVKSYASSVDLSNKGLRNQDLPGSRYPIVDTTVLNLSSNRLDNLGFLGDVKSAFAIDLKGNPLLDDISGLSEFERGEVYFDKSIFAKTPASDSLFCLGMNNGNVRVFVNGSGLRPESNDICR
jgi:hypothetical protein